MADLDTLLQLQALIVQALALADQAGLHDVGINLDAARLQTGEYLRRCGQAALIVAVPLPDEGASP